VTSAGPVAQGEDQGAEFWDKPSLSIGEVKLWPGQRFVHQAIAWPEKRQARTWLVSKVNPWPGKNQVKQWPSWLGTKVKQRPSQGKVRPTWLNYVVLDRNDENLAPRRNETWGASINFGVLSH